MTAPTITIHLETMVELEVAEVWPDGDAPDVVTADAVMAAMETCGSKRRVLDEWMLLEDIDVTVTVDRPNPAWKQDETLTGEPAPPRWLHDLARPWDRFAGARRLS